MLGLALKGLAPMELEFDSKLGRGAFADVWLARDSLGRKVAVKFFNDTTPSQAEQNALNHAKALARVEHPAVVRILALERQPHPESNVECLAIVMECFRDEPVVASRLIYGRFCCCRNSRYMRCG